VHEFLAAEGYTAVSKDMGGNYARRVLFKPHSGRAFVKRLDSDSGANVAREEIALAKRRVVIPAPVDDIELF
jgi:chemotaxis protein CheD